MLFNSFSYLVFLPVVFLAYHCAPNSKASGILLVASSLFYAAFVPAYLLILLALICVHYWGARAIERSGKPQVRRSLVVACVLLTLATLVTFKYLDWLLGGVPGLPRPLALPLPLGLSFHSLQAISYVLDVYHGKIRAERRVVVFANYVMFFPQAVAGPIERGDHLLPQLQSRRTPRDKDLREGISLILLGLVRKCMIADVVGTVVDRVFSNVAISSTLDILVAAGGFGIQIYSDFAGYSLIAQGSALLFGIRLGDNFDRPYLSTDVSRFWRRWHISLSSWFRDYVYVPLGGSRQGLVGEGFAVLVVFLLSGLWHGANLTFIAWGLWHALALIAHRLWIRFRPNGMRLPSSLGWFLTFTTAQLGWIFFRASSLDEATHAFRILWAGRCWPAVLPVSGMWQVVALGAASFLLDAVARVPALQVPGWSRPMRWATYYLAIGALFWWGRFGELKFIYFQF